MTNFEGDPGVFKDLPPFSWFTDKELCWALPTVQHRKYAARVLIQRAGDIADGLYILLSGRVQVLHQDSDGREFIAELVGPHDFFGELELFHGGKCIASIRSAQNCELLYIPRPVVLKCLEGNARATMCMLRKLAKRLGAAHGKLAHLALSDVQKRVAYVLLENTCDAEREAAVPIGAEQLAALVGCSREMVSRVVRTMVEQGVVRRDGRRLTILQRQALHKIAGLTEAGAAHSALD